MNNTENNTENDTKYPFFISTESFGCTFNVTGRKYHIQRWATCYTCFGYDESEGACLSCIDTCHKDHDISAIKITPFFCDCGDRGYCRKNTDSSVCTFHLSGKQHFIQQWATCYDCFDNAENGACMSCLKTCHNGHNIGKIRDAPFFCDCGDKDLCKKLSKSHAKSSLSTVECIQNVSNLGKSNNTLAWKLFSALEKDSVYSPLSIAYILSLLHSATVENSEKQLTDLLGVKYTLNDFKALMSLFNTDIVKMANAIIVNQSVKIEDSYMDFVGELALLSQENFSNPNAVARKVNDFISANTNDLIKDVLDPSVISSDTLMVLINTLYFKTVWDKQFKKYMTRTELFNKVSNVEMMTTTGNFPYYGDETVQIMEMPYKGKQFSMGFILANDEKILGELPEDLLVLPEDLSVLPLESEYVEVHIPKFTHRTKIDLIPVLTQLGVSDIFDSKSRMDLMYQGAFVSTVLHEAVVIVDEAGTEAAATTVAVCTRECSRVITPFKIFNANRSFVYYIKHIPTNTLLFVGDFQGSQLKN